MKKNFELSQLDFDNLLGWLAADREEAGEKYERIREGLMRFFRFRGCSDSASLADETMNRVALKVSTFTFEKEVKVISVFYGFASNIYLEYITQDKKREVEFDPNSPFRGSISTDLENPEDAAHECLERCLRQLQSDERELVVRYYSEEKSARFALRKELANMLDLKAGALHTRVYRIRNVLKLCIEQCLNKNDCDKS